MPEAGTAKKRPKAYPLLSKNRSIIHSSIIKNDIPKMLYAVPFRTLFIARWIVLEKGKRVSASCAEVREIADGCDGLTSS
jgi:hypothetical protein